MKAISRFSAAFFIFCVWMGLGFGGPARATSAAPVVDARLQTILDALPVGEQTAVIVYLVDQARFQPSAARPRSENRRDMIQSLRSQALRSQAGLLALVDRHNQSGEVSRYASLWITNALAVTANAAVIQEMAALPGRLPPSGQTARLPRLPGCRLPAWPPRLKPILAW